MLVSVVVLDLVGNSPLILRAVSRYSGAITSAVMPRVIPVAFAGATASASEYSS